VVRAVEGRVGIWRARALRSLSVINLVVTSTERKLSVFVLFVLL
jgi:hypothetical protein